MKKLIIFDLDGTLLNTIDDIMDATNQALSKLKFPTHDVNKYKIFVGNGIDKMFERALPNGEKTTENISKMRDLFLPYYAKHGKDKTAPYQGIKETLLSLKQKGIKIAVASNKFHEGTLAVMNEYFFDIPFDVIFGLRDGHQPKPNPGIVFDILSECQISNKNDVLYVGDTSIDMQTATNAGIEKIAVTWGFRSREELLSCQPEYIIDQPKEILEIIKKAE
ncbi:MAG: HAD family hydrolase [Paludibacteraceae bacterium]|nr:HAD family hydrolase [Paludibacteraceae bacterium]